MTRETAADILEDLLNAYHRFNAERNNLGDSEDTLYYEDSYDIFKQAKKEYEAAYENALTLLTGEPNASNAT